jgi:hypothetical protein
MLGRMDPVTGAVIIAGLRFVGKPGAEVVRDFVGRVLGPTGDVVGKAVAGSVEEWAERRKRLGIDTLESAARMLDDANRTASPVPGRVLFPLLHAASLEEDDDLRRMWATLLANAADSSRQDDLPPSFVSILRELSPVEAVLLHALHLEEVQGSRRVDYGSELPTARFNPEKIKISIGTDEGAEESGKFFRDLQLPFRNFRVVADNLMRLGLVEQHYSGPAYGGLDFSSRVYSELTLTPLGHHLVQQCAIAPTMASALS